MMTESNNLPLTELLKSQVNRYAIVGIIIAIISILTATVIVSYQLVGNISLRGIYLAQTTNPAIWALDITPFIFAYWGQSFFYRLSDKAKSYLQYKEQEFRNENINMKLQYYYESNHDKLTKLPNRLLFTEKTKQAISRTKNEQKLAVIIVKIKSFRQLSASLNAYEINEVLQQFAEKLKTILLEPFMLDINREMCFTARIQTDEFALLLPQLNEKKSLAEGLKRLSKKLTGDIMVSGIPRHIDVICGATLYPAHSEDAEELVHLAQSAVYYANEKSLAYTLYDHHMKKEHYDYMKVLFEVKNALEQQSIELRYQPWYHLKTGQLAGVQAQVHFTSPQIQAIPIERILSYIENTTLARELVQFVMDMAIKQVSRWHHAGYSIGLSLKLSALDISDDTLLPRLKQSLNQYQLSADYIELCFTEQACLTDQNRSQRIMEALAHEGVKLTIEDFCCGYSSFIYLVNFPVHKVKIDASFIDNMMTEHKKFLLVKSMISIAKNLRLQVMADMHFNSEILKKLDAMGCQYTLILDSEEGLSVEEMQQQLLSHLPVSEQR